MFINPKKKTDSNFNKPIYGLSGKFTLSQGVVLPYFTCNLEIERAVEELRIAEQVPPTLDNKWSLNELFQREIDEDRVKHEIIRGYLLDPRKIKFFNAITIVLMPKKVDGGLLDNFEQADESEIPPIPWSSTDEQDAEWKDYPDMEVANFGGVQLARIGDTARLRWDSERVLAVAVDGQHRLWSLRTFREDPEYRGGTLKIFERETSLPVIFVLLDPKAGYENQQDHNQYTIRGISRELFTDLNKNAKKVDKARELILNDGSITALCVRTLLTEATAEDKPGLLPLSMIRWQDDQNRFDSSYFLNSLVHLELVVKEMLDLKEPSDPMDKKQVETFIKTINSTLGVNGEVKYEGRSLTTYYNEDYCDDEGEPVMPFARLPQQYLTTAVDGFTTKFRPWMVKLLLDFKPYQQLLKYARENDLITGAFGGFVSQTSKHKEAIKQEMNNKDSQWHHREILTPITYIGDMKDDEWAYKAIFQKAMLRLGKKIEVSFKGKDKTLGDVDTYLEFLNRLYDQGILKLGMKLSDGTYLWTHIALNANNQKIKVARSVENRILGILTLWYYGSRKLEIDSTPSQATESPRRLLNFFAANSSRDNYPDCDTAFKEVHSGFNNNSFFGKNAEKLNDKKKERLVKEHFTEVFLAGLPRYDWKSTTDTDDGSEDIGAIENKGSSGEREIQSHE